MLVDKSIDDRLRHYNTWIASRNLGNEASDESVEALVTAVQARYDIPQRWYTLKAKLLGIDTIADFDRMASVASTDQEFGWSEARDLVLDAYASFSPDLADVARRFFDESWIDAPVRPGKRPGAFCAYTVPSAHPYLLLNWTSRRRDVLTLAHEMGHSIHTLLSHETQPFVYAGYTIFVAEVPSTLSEALLLDLMLERATTRGNIPAIDLCRARAEIYWKARTRYPEAALAYRSCAGMGGAHAEEDAFLSARSFTRVNEQ